MTTKEEMLAHARRPAQAAAAPAPEAAPEVATQAAPQEQAVAAAAAEKEAKAAIENNAIRKIAEDESKSTEQRLSEISAYLTAENEDYSTALKRFVEFEVHFAHEQNRNTEFDLEGMANLRAELEGMKKAIIEKIMKDLTDLQGKMAYTDKLTEIAERARLDGTTIQKLRAAQENNDKLVSEIKALTASIEQQKTNVANKQAILNTQLDLKTASEKGRVNKAMRYVSGPDKAIANAITLAQEQLTSAQGVLGKYEQDLAQRETERRTELESGAFSILRTLEATDDDVNKNIIEASRTAETVIRGEMAQVTNLIVRASYSDAKALEISDAISAAEQRVTVLKGAIQNVSNATHQQSEALKKRLVDLDAKIAATAEDSADRAVLNVERITLQQTQDASLKYEKALNEAILNFDTLEGENTEAKSRAQQFAVFVTAMKKNFTQLNTVALPTTAKQFHIQLETQHAMQTNELGNAIAQFNEAGRKITADQFKKLVDVTNEVHDQERKSLNALRTTLEDSDRINTDYANTLITQGGENKKAQLGVRTASQKLQETLAALRELGTELTGRADVDGEPAGGPTPPANPSAPEVASPGGSSPA